MNGTPCSNILAGEGGMCWRPVAGRVPPGLRPVKSVANGLHRVRTVAEEPVLPLPHSVGVQCSHDVRNAQRREANRRRKLLKSLVISTEEVGLIGLQTTLDRDVSISNMPGRKK